jgi:hypothetical protein
MKLKLICLFALALFVRQSFAQKSPMDTTTYGKNTAVGKYADIRGFKMYYEVYGKGEPMLLSMATVVLLVTLCSRYHILQKATR